MRLQSLLIAVLLLSASCIPLSLHPLYTDEDLVYDPGLEGAWGEEGEQWIFEKADEKEYKLTIKDNDESFIFSAHLVQLKEYRFLDMQASEVAGLSDFFGGFLVPAHGIFQIEREGDTFRLRTMDYEWLEDRLEKGRLWVAHEELDDWFVFTADTKRMQRFFLKWVDHEDAYGGWEETNRLSATGDAPAQS
ncbi:MAG: hypothetical protein AMXMBFR82_00510 [Candidatus Hydrogenedentota bacterium]